MPYFILPLSVILVALGFRTLYKLRLIRNTPTSKIRSIAMGLVEIKGQAVQTDEPLISPITKKECLYYMWKIERFESSNKSSRWRTIKKGQEGRYIWVQDDTGSVLIDTQDATIEISKWVSQRIDKQGENQLNARTFAQEKGIKISGMFTNTIIRVTEKCITHGQELYIMGTATDNPFVEDASADEGYRDVMIKKGDNQKFFYISDKKEHKIENQLLWLTTFLFISGVGTLLYGLIKLVS
jgi:hypothetical protein